MECEHRYAEAQATSKYQKLQLHNCVSATEVCKEEIEFGITCLNQKDHSRLLKLHLIVRWCHERYSMSRKIDLICSVTCLVALYPGMTISGKREL